MYRRVFVWRYTRARAKKGTLAKAQQRSSGGSPFFNSVNNLSIRRVRGDRQNTSGINWLTRARCSPSSSPHIQRIKGTPCALARCASFLSVSRAISLLFFALCTDCTASVESLREFRTFFSIVCANYTIHARGCADADEKWKKRKKQKKCSTRARSGKETGRSNGKEAALYVWRSAACMCIGAFHFVFRHTCLVHLANGIGKPAAHRRIEYIYVYIYIHIHTYIHRCTDRKRAPDTCEKRSDPGERERERVQKERKKIESRWGEYRSPSSPGEIEKKSERERKRERESSTGFDLYLLAIR